MNPDKLEVQLLICNMTSDGGIRPVLDGVALPPKVQVYSLGFFLDPLLLLDTQVLNTQGLLSD